MQGKTPRDGVRLMADAKALEDAGAYSVVLETVPAALASKITQQLRVPTIGIGAGPYCTGQVQVVHDLLGLFQDFKPKHARRFIEGAELLRDAFTEYREAVESGAFPTEAESHMLDEAMRERIESTRIERPDRGENPLPIRPASGPTDVGETGYAPLPALTDLEGPSRE
jgi:3-methyl-2-oxobutanoate hydroxymethyltransferase